MKLNLIFAVALLGLAACAKQSAFTNESPALSASFKNFPEAIVGGELVSANNSIAQTTVGIYNTSLHELCTGSLYGESYVITAAHCLEGELSHFEVRFGVDLRKPVIIRKVIAAQKNPQYRAGQIKANNADIAIIKYEGTLPVAAGFKAVQILGDDRVLKAGQDIIVAGYGIDGQTRDTGAGVLRQVHLELKDPQFSETEMSVKQGFFKGACGGDSGGPAFLDTKSGGLQIWGVHNSGAGIPHLRKCMFRSTFTRISVYQSWIDSVLRSL